MAFLKPLYHLRIWVLPVVFLLLNSSISHAQENLQLYEHEIKAGLLYNFLKYTDWPDQALSKTNKINLCILGNDPFEGYLEPMKGRSVNQREIFIRNVYSIKEINSCQMLFINEAEKSKWLELRNYISEKNILTVGDLNGFIDSGGMIEFIKKEEHITVALNIESVNQANLHVEDRLLKLVTVVSSDKRR